MEPLHGFEVTSYTCKHVWLLLSSSLLKQGRRRLERHAAAGAAIMCELLVENHGSHKVLGFGDAAFQCNLMTPLSSIRGESH